MVIGPWHDPRRRFAVTLMASLILFQFHGEFDLCAERVKLLRALNPDVPVYGLYGGPPAEAAAAAGMLGSLLDGIYTVSAPNGNWKRIHQDLTLAEWFNAVGHRIPFDVLYDIEYDLLLMEPLPRLYPAIDQSTAAFSGLHSFEAVRPRWYWTSVGVFPRRVDRYLRFMQTRFGLPAPAQRFVAQGPFPLLPRAFIEKMSGLDYPAEIFDDIVCEISFPGLAEALGFAVIDTGLHPPWIASVPGIPASPLFHCENRPRVSLAQVAAELANQNGRRAFHPVKTFIACDALLELRRRQPHIASLMPQ
jgi:hypothetical protein